MRTFLRLAHRLRRIYWFLLRPVTLGVRIILINEDRILLVRHRYEDAWFLPGGGVKRSETLEQAVRREAAEECGAQLGTIDFLGIYANFQEFKSDHIGLFFATDFTIREKPGLEIEQMAYFSLESLPEDLSPGNRRKIEAYMNENLEKTGLW